MDVTQSHTENIIRDLGSHSQQNMDFFPGYGEKTVRFSVNDAAMDITQSHTVNIIRDLDFHSQQREERASPGRELAASPACDVAVDKTQSYSVNINTGLNLQPNQNVDFIPMTGENTVGLNENSAAMDVMQSHLVNMASSLEVHPGQNDDGPPPSGEKTVRFTDSDTAMDVTKSHTMNIASDVNFYSQPSVPCAASGEKTVRFGGDDAAMDTPTDVAQSRSVNTDTTSGIDSDVLHRDSDMIYTEETVGFPLSLEKREDKMCAAPFFTSDAGDARGFLHQLGLQKLGVEVEKKQPVNPAVLDCPAVGPDAAVAEVQTDRTLRTDEPPHCASAGSGETKWTCEDTTIQTDVSAAHLTGDGKECEPRKQIGPKCNGYMDVAPTRKSKRLSFADLNAKIRRLSQMISAAPNSAESCTAALLQPERDVDRNAQEKVDPSPAVGPALGPAAASDEEAKWEQSDVEPMMTTAAAVTPFKLKTKQLMSRLSMGGFRPRLPQRAKASDGMATPAGVQTKTLSTNVTNQLSDFDADLSDINDEELDNCEDISEALGSKSPCKDGLKLSPPEDLNMHGHLEDGVFEDDIIPAARGKKSLLPTDEDDVEDERGRKTEAGFNTVKSLILFILKFQSKTWYKHFLHLCVFDIFWPGLTV